MKTICKIFWYTFILILIFSSLSFAQKKCVCYYLSDSGGWELPKDNCIEYSYLMKSLNMGETDIKPMEEFSFEDANNYEVVYMSGYGLPDGFFTKYSSEPIDSTRISWQDMATKFHVPLLLIDSCFSGYVFDYPYNSTTVITSANKTPSWNVVLKDGSNISSFIVMLRCIFDVNYVCPVNISSCAKYNSWLSGFTDPQECQFNIIVDKTFRNTQSHYEFKTDPVAGMTTVNINGKPWR